MLEPNQPPCGATLTSDGVTFRVWAPRARSMAVRLSREERVVPMTRSDDELYQVTVPGLGAGTDYGYLIDGERLRPDPVSRCQPQGVHGVSRVVDPASYGWQDASWGGLPIQHYILYELHTGTFTPQGTYAAVRSRLPYLRDLGVTAVELMPVAEFPGERNWGYDGVHLFAPQSSYGSPDDLRALIDTCHREGMAFVLDVVYNHLGPEGNYLREYGPYFSARYSTPWGEALNFDGPGSDRVREYFIQNALYWITEYHVDALRLDAIHGIFDFSALHLLEELTEAVHERGQRLGRPAYVIAESDLNDTRIIRPRNCGGYGLDAQWSDDFHHSVHTVLTGATRGYFADFGRLSDLTKALTNGFVYDGRRSVFRQRRHGNPSRDLPGHQFVVYIQNHDQVANGSGGSRLSTLVSPGGQRVAAVLLLLAPNLPLLFQGQEYGETAPFFYFASHGDASLIEAVRQGRQQEFLSFQFDRDFPDPQAEQTFVESRLNWSRLDQPEHAALLRLYRDLIRLRQQHVCLHDSDKDRVRVTTGSDDTWMIMERGCPRHGQSFCLVNLSPQPQHVPHPLGPHSPSEVVIFTEDAIYGGSGQPLRRAPSAANQEFVVLPGWSAAIFLEPPTVSARNVP